MVVPMYFFEQVACKCPSSDVWSCLGQHAIKKLMQLFTRPSSTGVSSLRAGIPSLLHVISYTIQALKQESFAKCWFPIISLYFLSSFLPPSGCMTTKVLGISVPAPGPMSTPEPQNTYTTSFHGMNVHFGSIQRAYPIIIDYPKKKNDILKFSQPGNHWIWWIRFVTISFIVKSKFSLYISYSTCGKKILDTISFNFQRLLYLHDTMHIGTTANQPAMLRCTQEPCEGSLALKI